MKIGFIIDYFDFRNDIRQIIKLISQTNEVVLFCKKEHNGIVKSFMNDAVEIRVIDENQRNLNNKVWDFLFLLFAKIPKSRKNFYLTELFRINNIKGKNIKLKSKFILSLKMLLPDFLRYDTYLLNIQSSRNTLINGVDYFIFFTDIYDHYFLSRVINENKKASVYVYSWDHPCKFLRFSNKINYLVWNEGLKEDLIALQHIDKSNIKISGASQFAYVKQFLDSEKNLLQPPFDFEYIYFGCSVASIKLLEQEIKIIKTVSSILLEMQLPIKLVVRPYPILKDWTYYDGLRHLPNVILDDLYRTKDLSVTENNLFEKYTKIHFAKGFFHLGTTLGLEACFTNTPSFIIDFEKSTYNSDYLSMYDFVHQYQNEKYLLLEGFDNVIKHPEGLKTIFMNIYKDKSPYLTYNRAVTKNMYPYSFAEFAEKLLSL